jgi:hypothetical protein
MKVSRQYPKRVKLRQSENVLLGLILRRQMTLRKCWDNSWKSPGRKQQLQSIANATLTAHN